MTAGIENEQKAKDAFKLSLFIGKEASISTNKTKSTWQKKRKKAFLQRHNGWRHLGKKEVSAFKTNVKI